jgi:hypothetical protein
LAEFLLLLRLGRAFFRAEAEFFVAPGGMGVAGSGRAPAGPFDRPSRESLEYDETARQRNHAVTGRGTKGRRYHHHSLLEGTTMLCRAIPAGLLAAAGLLAPAAQAGDLMRLDLKKAPAPTASLSLNLDGDEADTLDAAYRGGYRYGGSYGYRGGYRYGGSYGYRGGYRYGGSYGYRGYYGGYYPRYNYGYYPRYNYGYYPGYYYGYYAPYYYPGVSISVYRPAYYYPIDTSAAPMPPAAALDYGPGTYGGAPSAEPLPAPRPVAPSQGTFPYDGGPRAPVPMPKSDPAPTAAPPAAVPLEGRSVSLPGKPAKLSYPAYGEPPARTTTVVKDRLTAKAEPIKQGSR